MIVNSESRFYKDQADRIIASVDLRLDGITAGTSTGPFLARQLESIDKRTQLVIERELPFLALMPINTTECKPGSKMYTWRQTDRSGQFKKVGPQGKNLPLSDVSKEEFSFPQNLYGGAYELTTQELRAAILTGTPLSTDKADAVRRAYNEARNYLAMYGDAGAGKTGFLNSSDITPTVAADNAGATSTEWADKTGLEMYKDVADAVNVVFVASLGKVRPNVCALPTAQYSLAMTTKFNPNGNVDKTVMDVCRETLKLRFEVVSELTDAHTVSAVDYDLMMVYESDPMIMEFMQAMELSMRPGQWTGLTYTVPFETELVGTVIRKPVAFAATYGI